METSEASFNKPEDTQERIVRAVHEEVSGPIATVKRIQFWATLAITIAGLGFGGAMYLNRYAMAADLERAVETHAQTAKMLHAHIEEEAARMGSLEAQGRNIENDYHWQREQLQRIADRVGAQRVPAPDHEPAPPAERHVR